MRAGVPDTGNAALRCKGRYRGGMAHRDPFPQRRPSIREGAAAATLLGMVGIPCAAVGAGLLFGFGWGLLVLGGLLCLFAAIAALA